MKLGDDVIANGKNGVVVKLTYEELARGEIRLVGVGVYLNPRRKWDEERAKGFTPKFHMFTPAEIAQI
jgi:hypothetical protein